MGVLSVRFTNESECKPVGFVSNKGQNRVKRALCAVNTFPVYAEAAAGVLRATNPLGPQGNRTSHVERGRR